MNVRNLAVAGGHLAGDRTHTDRHEPPGPKRRV